MWSVTTENDFESSLSAKTQKQLLPLQWQNQHWHELHVVVGYVKMHTVLP